MIWLLFLPVRLAFVLLFGVLWLPFVLLRGVLKLVGAIVLLPIVLILAAVGLLLGGLIFVVPLGFLAIFVWVLVLMIGRPVRTVF